MSVINITSATTTVTTNSLAGSRAPPLPTPPLRPLLLGLGRCYRHRHQHHRHDTLTHLVSAAVIITATTGTTPSFAWPRSLPSSPPPPQLRHAHPLVPGRRLHYHQHHDDVAHDLAGISKCRCQKNILAVSSPVALKSSQLPNSYLNEFGRHLT